MSAPVPFRATFAASRIADLRARLAATHWPQEIDHGDADTWDYGVPQGYLRDLVDYWASGFDWGAAEAFFNRHNHFVMNVDDLPIHFIHAHADRPDAMPLLLMHGWPGSVFEFWEVIPRLTRPELYGGKAQDAFHVVCPSLPGYGYSAPTATRGMSPKRAAARHDALMRQLGYDRYLVQGGNWGALVARYMPDLCSQRLICVHYNLVLPTPPADVADLLALLTEAERAQRASTQAHDFSVSGYSHEQVTKPQTLGIGLSDSPAGLAAWIAEKFFGWTGDNSMFLSGPGRDWLLCNISLYWMTGSIATSIRLYREYFDAIFAGDTLRVPCAVPTGITDYPAEMWRSPRSWAEREFPLVRWNAAPRGGHFAALEEPQFFAEELWRFRKALA